MKVYIVAATLGQYQDALRALGLHERAAVHLTALPTSPVDGPVYIYPSGWLEQVQRAA